MQSSCSLDAGWLHVGDALFPPCEQEWHSSFESGESESLLSMAAREICSSNAVSILLARGADPNRHLVHFSFNGAMNPTCGPLVAWQCMTLGAIGVAAHTIKSRL